MNLERKPVQIQGKLNKDGHFVDAKPEPTNEKPLDLGRTMRRAIKRGGMPMAGNNRPNRKGATYRQEEVAAPMIVGEETRLIEVVTMSRGKGGKKKYVKKKVLISRQILLDNHALREQVMGLVIRSNEAESEDSIKQVDIAVMVPSNGRVARA